MVTPLHHGQCMVISGIRTYLSRSSPSASNPHAKAKLPLPIFLLPLSLAFLSFSDSSPTSYRSRPINVDLPASTWPDTYQHYDTVECECLSPTTIRLMLCFPVSSSSLLTFAMSSSCFMFNPGFSLYRSLSLSASSSFASASRCSAAKSCCSLLGPAVVVGVTDPDPPGLAEVLPLLGVPGWVLGLLDPAAALRGLPGREADFGVEAPDVLTTVKE